MKKIKLAAMIMMLTIVFADSILVQASAGRDDISGLVGSFRDETRCDSVSVAVVTSGDVRFYGDKEGLYQIGSMTKAFTGLAALKLISEGKISLDDLLQGSHLVEF